MRRGSVRRGEGVEGEGVWRGGERECGGRGSVRREGV